MAMKRQMFHLLDGARTVFCAALVGASLAAAASAEEAGTNQAVRDLTQPNSSVEVGIGDVTDGSYKFGEYNGLQNSGQFGVGSFDLRGGGSYDSSDATRWRINATNLGLDTRNATAEYGEQGRYRVTLGFDEIRHNITDSYSTPYRGVGTDVLGLPSSWLVPIVPLLSATAPNARGLSDAVATSSALVRGVLTPPSGAKLAASNTLMAADLPLFGQANLHTTRSRYDGGASYLITPKWEFAIKAGHEDKEGAKPMGSITATTGGDISTILADPIDQSTDQISATLGYHAKSEFVQFVYNGSIFHNNIPSLTWTNWAQPATTMTMSSAPNNESHQLAVTAGKDLTRTTRLVLNAAYTRNTRDGSFLTDASTPLVPNLDGLVVTKAFNLKLTNRPRRDLDLSLGYKFDERDNQTPVRTFAFYDANVAASATPINSAFSAALGVPATLLANNVNVNDNRPYSRRVNQVNADADLKLTPTETIKAGYEFQQLDRWCNGTWIDCMDAATTQENTAKFELRSSPRENLNTSIGYAYARRTVKAWNENAFLALVPLANVSPTGATGGASAYSFMLENGLSGYGPVEGYAATTGNMNLFFPLNNALANATYQNQNRISEILGLLRYNMAPRERNRIRGNLDWQATQTVAIQGSVDYRDDNYNDSLYGLLKDHDWSANLDATYTPTENLGVTLFYTHEDQRSKSAGDSYTANSAAKSVNGSTAISGGCFSTIALRNANNKIDPCLNWGTDMQNQTNVFGVSLDRKNLLASKLDLGAQIIVSRATDENNVNGGNYVNNPLAVAGAPAGTIAAYFVPATALPTVFNNSIELRFNARYAINKASSLRLTYIYGDMSSSDYAYQGFQLGGLAGGLPTGQTSPSYVVHVIILSYATRF